MQVVTLTTPYIHSYLLNTWPSIRHLDLETHIPDLLLHVDMRAFTQLETLRLRSWGLIPASINSIHLDLSQVHSLRLLHIENWSPKSINVTSGCQVYAKWEDPQEYPEHPEDQPDWLLSPAWTAWSSNLVSFHLEEDYERSAHDAVHALHTIMECHERLKSLRLAVYDVGSRQTPLTFPASHLKGLRASLTVEITTTVGCWIQLDDMTPFSNQLVLNIRGPLHIGFPAALGSMLWHHLEGASASSRGEGPESLWGQLANAIPEVHNENPEDDGAGCCGSCTPHLTELGKHAPPLGLLIFAGIALKCVCC